MLSKSAALLKLQNEGFTSSQSSSQQQYLKETQGDSFQLSESNQQKKKFVGKRTKRRYPDHLIAYAQDGTTYLKQNQTNPKSAVRIMKEKLGKIYNIENMTQKQLLKQFKRQSDQKAQNQSPYFQRVDQSSYLHNSFGDQFDLDQQTNQNLTSQQKQKFVQNRRKSMKFLQNSRKSNLFQNKLKSKQQQIIRDKQKVISKYYNQEQLQNINQLSKRLLNKSQQQIQIDKQKHNFDKKKVNQQKPLEKPKNFQPMQIQQSNLQDSWQPDTYITGMNSNFATNQSIGQYFNQQKSIAKQNQTQSQSNYVEILQILEGKASNSQFSTNQLNKAMESAGLNTSFINNPTKILNKQKKSIKHDQTRKITTRSSRDHQDVLTNSIKKDAQDFHQRIEIEYQQKQKEQQQNKKTLQNIFKKSKSNQFANVSTEDILDHKKLQQQKQIRQQKDKKKNQQKSKNNKNSKVTLRNDIQIIRQASQHNSSSQKSHSINQANKSNKKNNKIPEQGYQNVQNDKNQIKVIKKRRLQPSKHITDVSNGNISHSIVQKKQQLKKVVKKRQKRRRKTSTSIQLQNNAQHLLINGSETKTMPSKQIKTKPSKVQPTRQIIQRSYPRRNIIPPVQFWKNQRAVYGKNRELNYVQTRQLLRLIGFVDSIFRGELVVTDTVIKKNRLHQFVTLHPGQNMNFRGFDQTYKELQINYRQHHSAAILFPLRRKDVEIHQQQDNIQYLDEPCLITANSGHFTLYNKSQVTVQLQFNLIMNYQDDSFRE